MSTARRTALICCDVQSDFLPGGALGVADGDAVIAPLLRAAADADMVVATRDWHPPAHVSFVERGGPWPVHCVAGSAGGAMHPDVDRIAEVVVSKGTHVDAEAYSAFDGTPLAGLLRAAGVGHIVVGGLATDYCIRATVLDGLREGFDVTVLAAAVRAVDVRPGDGARAIEEMRSAGAVIAG